MKIDDFKEAIENQFVYDYDTLYDFMTNINDILDELNIDNKYETYDEFCLQIEDQALLLFKQNNNIIITPKILTNILNNMIKNKIITDSQYNEKLNNLNYDDNIINEIKNIIKHKK